jgi:hypothetical protein
MDTAKKWRALWLMPVSQGQLGPVGARLAGESALKDAFAGKPGSYEKRFARLTDRH